MSITLIAKNQEVEIYNAPCLKAFLKDKISNIIFKKKDGSIRELIGRVHVQKYVKGTGKALTKAVEDRIVRIFDMKKDAWRSFDINDVISIKAFGKQYYKK